MTVLCSFVCRPSFSVLDDWLEILKSELEDYEEIEGLAPSTEHTEALAKQILLYENSPGNDGTPLRPPTGKGGWKNANHRRKISLDLGYEETSSPAPGFVPPSRCVSADPCCPAPGDSGGLPIPQRLNTVFSCSESALGAEESTVILRPSATSGWEAVKLARMDIDEQDSAISSHNSSSGSYFS